MQLAVGGRAGRFAIGDARQHRTQGPNEPLHRRAAPAGANVSTQAGPAPPEDDDAVEPARAGPRDRASRALQRVVVVGSGQGGFQLALSLRQGGFAGEIVLVGDEPGLPYQRPPLSKAYLSDGRSDKLPFRPRDFFERERIELREGTRATSIDREARRVDLADGTALPYDHLVLATGTRNRTLPLEGIDCGGVLGLRTLAHADGLASQLRGARHVAIVGGGFIGLEVATAASKIGARVTVVEAADRLMARAVSPPISDHFLALHERMGTKVHLATQLRSIACDAGGDARSATLSTGASLTTDLVVIGAGVVPNDELARDAGIACGDGILVDETMLTDDPSISAIGDCAAHVDEASGERVRLESVQNAADQARCVAARLLGQPEPYRAVPWFWSDQAGAKLQIAGLIVGADEHRPVRHGPGLAVISLRGDRLVAVEAVDAPAQYMAGRRLLSQIPVTRRELDDVGYDLRAVMTSRAA